ncbi:MAG TPA: glycosyl hydrolase [Micromonosporaceae bacterium]|nr:glycosyl hydrolase [Micromonosporaceae bacterium]
MRRPSLPLTLGVLAAVALLGYVFFLVTRPGDRQATNGAGPPATSRSATPGPPVVFPPSGKVFLGLGTDPGPYDFAPVDAFVAATRHQPAALQFSQGWAHHQFDRALFDRIADRSMLPILSWEPWDYTASGPSQTHGEQPAYRLSRIANGEFDEYVRSWAQGIKDLGYPVAVRFGHEMNGFWYPWCEQSNGNRPGDYVKAYHRIHRIFTEAGADKVTWLWSPNVTYPGAEPLKGLYPGDRYVDWIGLSGYYGTPGVEQYRSFDRIFDATIDELRRFTKRPIVITETGASNATGRRAQWIREMFRQLPQRPDIIGVIWFETVKDLDWRIATVPDAAQAFAEGSRHPRYNVAWSRSTVPLTEVRVPAGG